MKDKRRTPSMAAPTTGLAPARGAVTRERILAAAADLIHARGVNATTLLDVLDASKTGKGQFYQHFESRDHLVREVLARNRAFLENALAAAVTSWDDVRAWLDSSVAMMQAMGCARGCPVGGAVAGLHDDQEAERAELRATFAMMRKRLERFFAAEQAAGRLVDSAEPPRMATFALAAIQGGTILALAERKIQPLKATVDEAFAHLLSFVPRNRSATRRAGGEL